MSSFEDRQKGFEAKYQHDQELQFKVTARRNRLLGEWVAQKLGLSGDEAVAYARSVVQADFEKPGDDDVIEKVIKDLGARGIAVTPAAIRDELDRLFPIAKDQIMKQA